MNGLRVTYHEDICKIDQHHGVAVLPPACNVQTNGSDCLGSPALNKIEANSKLEDLTSSF